VVEELPSGVRIVELSSPPSVVEEESCVFTEVEGVRTGVSSVLVSVLVLEPLASVDSEVVPGPTAVSGATAFSSSLLVEVLSEIESPFVFVTLVESSTGSSVTVYVEFVVPVTKMVTSIVVVMTRTLAVGQSSTAELSSHKVLMWELVVETAGVLRLEIGWSP
jgi:hypothetical protein